MSTISYQAGGRESLDAIRSLWEALNRLHAEVSPHFKRQFASGTFSARTKELAQKAQNGEIRVDIARQGNNGPTVGYLVATIDPHGCGEVDSIFVDEAFRGRGVGTCLLKRCLRWFDEKSAQRRVVTVVTGNENTHAFYKKFGFFPRTVTLVQKAGVAE